MVTKSCVEFIEIMMKPNHSLRSSLKFFRWFEVLCCSLHLSKIINQLLSRKETRHCDCCACFVCTARISSWMTLITRRSLLCALSFLSFDDVCVCVCEFRWMLAFVDFIGGYRFISLNVTSKQKPIYLK